MEIPVELKTRLISELEFTVNQIRKEEDDVRKLYFLSAISGAIERTIRFFNNDELLVAHTIFQVNYNIMKERISLVKSGDKAIPLPDNLWEQISSNLDDFIDRVIGGDSLYPAVEKIMHLSYSLTGPGYYTFNYLESRR
jgi:hypothetical protein